jgi:outer membrane protein assembly factor BamB
MPNSIFGGSSVAMATIAISSFCFVLPAGAWESTIEFGNVDAVAVSAADDVFAAGIGSDNINAQPTLEYVLVTKSSSDGTPLWSTEIKGASANSDEELNAFLATPGSLLIGGKLAETGGWEKFAVVALDAGTGAEHWRYAQAVHPDVPSELLDEVGGTSLAVAVDSNGDVLATGIRRSFYFGVSTTDFHEGMLVKLDGSTGAELWRRSVSGTDATENPISRAALSHVVVAADGDPIVGGTVKNTGSEYDCVLARYDSVDGSEVWRVELSNSLEDWENVENLFVHPSGDLIARCTQQLVSVDISDGSVIWQEHLPTVGLGAAELVMTSTGDLVVGGSELVGPEDGDVSVMRVSGTDGSAMWQTTIPGLSPEAAADVSEIVLALEVDGNDNVFLASRTHSRSTGRDSRIHKLDAVSGDVSWGQILADREPRNDGGHGYRVADLAIDSAGNVVFGGQRYQGLYLTGKLEGDDGTVERPVAGRKFDLKTGASATLKFSTKDPAITPSVPGTSSDPTVFGASFTIHNPTTMETKTYDLPAAKWSRLDSLTGRGKYAYADEAQDLGPCTSASQRSGSLSVNCSGVGIDFTLDEASQGSLVAVMSIGSAVIQYCTVFDGEAIRRDATNRFMAKGAAAPSACPVLP